jgi:hypothetical protein
MSKATVWKLVLTDVGGVFHDIWFPDRDACLAVVEEYERAKVSATGGVIRMEGYAGTLDKAEQLLVLPVDQIRCFNFAEY